MNFDTAFALVIGHEGGYTPGKEDPGGETKFGISKRSYPGEDIPNLTLDRAKAIYAKDFWSVARCDELPELIRFDVFDTAVNSGVRTACKLLQRCVGVPEDGVIGQVTLTNAATLSPYQLLARYNGHRLKFMTDLEVWPEFSRGWARRVAGNLTRV